MLVTFITEKNYGFVVNRIGLKFDCRRDSNPMPCGTPSGSDCLEQVNLFGGVVASNPYRIRC